MLDDLLAGLDPLRLVILEGADGQHDLPDPRSLPFVVALLAERSCLDTEVSAADVVVDDGDATLLEAQIATNPVVAVTFAVLLRATHGVGVEPALALESATYSMLQAGAEFAAWRGSAAPAAPIVDTDATVRLDRAGRQLTITLDRPHRHNAITAQLRDELCDALTLALVDDSIEQVVLAGNGPSFCSGGDLSEFGARGDVAGAHLIRLTRSPARQLHQLVQRLGPRLEARIHGHTLGGGIEMAAFAGRVVADPDTSIGLPEIGLGLIPGAGGTVSLPRRIGRHRTAWLGLTGHTIDAETAVAWGLADALRRVRT